MPVRENLSSPVAVLHEGRIARIVLHDPARRNRLSQEMARALLVAVEEAAADARTGCILLEQSGEVFCSGLDFDELARSMKTEDFERLFQLQPRLSKPLIAAVRGACAGAGVGLLLQCHFVLAAQGTRFAVSDIHSAVWPALYFGAMSQALGPRRACELALTGRVFSAADALYFGLVHELVPPFELEDRALQLAAGLAMLSPAAVASGLLFAAANHQGEHRTARAAELLREALQSPDFLESRAAAREHRQPNWPSLKPHQ